MFEGTGQGYAIANTDKKSGLIPNAIFARSTTFRFCSKLRHAYFGADLRRHVQRQSSGQTCLNDNLLEKARNRQRQLDTVERKRL
jgi:hypothetical protein